MQRSSWRLVVGLVVLLGADPVAMPNPTPSWARALPDLDKIVLSIETVVQRASGAIQTVHGSGFVVGRRLFTVNHNLTGGPSPYHTRETYLEGIRLTPTSTNPAHDLALFALPPELCERHCNEESFGPDRELPPQREVVWLRKVPGDRALKSARVRNYAIFGDAPEPGPLDDRTACRAHLVVEVDQPFLPGSSGGPVLDAQTGEIVGMIQGSLEGRGGRSGFFKPSHCIQDLFGRAG